MLLCLTIGNTFGVRFYVATAQRSEISRRRKEKCATSREAAPNDSPAKTASGW
jgi:hypothetical protein